MYGAHRMPATAKSLATTGINKMQSQRRRDALSRIFEARVRYLLDNGFSTSEISKDTGKSLKHTAFIVDRINKE